MCVHGCVHACVQGGARSALSGGIKFKGNLDFILSSPAFHCSSECERIFLISSQDSASFCWSALEQAAESRPFSSWDVWIFFWLKFLLLFLGFDWKEPDGVGRAAHWCVTKLFDQNKTYFRKKCKTDSLLSLSLVWQAGGSPQHWHPTAKLRNL